MERCIHRVLFLFIRHVGTMLCVKYIYLLGRCVCFAGVQQPVCGPHHVRPAHVLGQNFHAAQEAGDHSGPQSAAR